MAGSSLKNPKWMSLVGWILTAVVFLFMGVLPIYMFTTQRATMEKGASDVGFDRSFVPVMAALEIACALVFVFPRTAVLGAILLTGYLGGAVCAHVRVHQPNFPFPIAVGVIVWLGLFFRDRRVRELAPWRF